ncbi:hypothetical protein [Pseudomonas saponiphila]|uniref:hypothetical protein n=1 Tax=Pseudomonas saponiphila TaxID=556534 RepID=UPI00115F7F9D|nr:hypothetical protein [Pseudomonas saponiphila]
MLFVIGTSVIVIGVLAVLLLESKKSRARIKAILDASVERQKALLQKHSDELKDIEHRHLDHVSEITKRHNQEIESLRDILAISDQDRDVALKAAYRDQEHVRLIQDRLDRVSALMDSWASGSDETASAVRHALKAEHSRAFYALS